MKIILTIILVLLGLFLNGFCQKLPKNFGKLETKLFIPQKSNQSLIVAFGGSEGGNIFAGESTKEVREKFLKRGFHFLTINYFGSKGIPKELDRISLDAIYDTISNRANQLDISNENTILLGVSRGGELILNLASNYTFKGVIAMVPSNVTVPSFNSKNPTSSWILNEKEVDFIQIDKKAINKKGWFTTIENYISQQKELDIGFIPLEKIKSFVLLTSGKTDKLWPSYTMCNSMIERLQKHDFKFPYKHKAFEGGHSAATHWPEVVKFLDEQLKNSQE